MLFNFYKYINNFFYDYSTNSTFILLFLFVGLNVNNNKLAERLKKKKLFKDLFLYKILC